MERRLITFVVLLVCVSVSSVQAYTSEEYNFSIDPPSGWTVDDTTTGAAVFFYGPTEGGFRVNVNIQVESLPTTMTVEQYASAGEEQLQSFDNYELVSEGARVINEVEAYELVFTFTDLGIDIKEKQVCVVVDKKGFIITYAASPTTYQKYLSAFESSVETFTILEPTPWYIQYWYVWVIVALAVGALAFYLIRRRAKAVPPPTAAARAGGSEPSEPPSPPSIKKRFCMSCGTELRAGARYCPNCGKKTDRAVEV